MAKKERFVEHTHRPECSEFNSCGECVRSRMVKFKDGKFTITCDICGHSETYHGFTYNQCLNAAIDQGWYSYKEGGEWFNNCKECAK